ncbi:hypothetical protein [Cognaticolwellia mytili]|uniref:hypothetical protein n=1 Tax=Cognaticolwellia mytili TaxID=1888913 RepID=UPI000A16ECD8|nr:hypothetical protein [Cognaticolwellia mytili]
MNIDKFNTEWCLLQNQFDSYEKHSLYIKLIGILVFISTEILDVVNVSVIFLLLVIWFQDGIWKTFQSRIESRLLHIEKCISIEKSEGAFQFNTQYADIRLTGLALINEYVRQAIRPTVAFPHLALILVFITQYFFYR